ncbi:hypothetical protein ACWKWV_09325 [Castellaniella ginsengisoli]
MNPLDALTFSVPPAAGSARAGGKESVRAAFPDAVVSSRTSISDLGRAMSKSASGSVATRSRYRDIDESDLPETVKHLLRMIRDLRERLAELERELRAIQADGSLDPETRRARLLPLRAQMSALSGALMSATQKLAALMREMRLDQARQMSAAQLAL